MPFRRRVPFRRAARFGLCISLFFGAVVGVRVLSAVPAFARSAGIAASGCDGCHNGGKAPTVTLTADPLNPTVGQTVTLTVSVSQTNGAVAGFFLTTANAVPGTFKSIESGIAVSDSGATHSTPRSGSGGQTVFKVQWTASQATGVEFDAYALSANGDKSSRGDAGGTSQLQMLIGCTGATYYIDQDADGYGTSDPSYPSRKDCTLPAGYSAQSGDCNDFNALIHPGAVELCDTKDNNCDGHIDENVVNQMYCEDKDGDGHGVVGGMTKLDCKPSAGFGDCGGDCNDNLASVHPGATEVCDGRDNDCNGNIDEGVRMTCGVGWCRRYAAGCTSICTPGEPIAETCNLFDDDCDGVIDNGTNQSLCGDSSLRCVQGRCVGDGSGSGGAVGTVDAGMSTPVQDGGQGAAKQDASSATLLDAGGGIGSGTTGGTTGVPVKDSSGASGCSVGGDRSATGSLFGTWVAAIRLIAAIAFAVVIPFRRRRGRRRRRDLPRVGGGR